MFTQNLALSLYPRFSQWFSKYKTESIASSNPTDFCKTLASTVQTPKGTPERSHRPLNPNTNTEVDDAYTDASEI